MVNFVDLFDSLPLPTLIGDEDNRFSAVAIKNYEQHRIGKDAQGMPLLLFSVTNTSSNRRPPSIILEHLAVLHNIDCCITTPDGTSENGQFTIVRCTSDNSVLHTHFLRMVSSIITILNDKPSQKGISFVINRLVELFQVMSKPPRKSVQGLWAELFLIARIKNPAILLDAWHSEPEDRYDFSNLDQRIEVKSTSSRVRQHHFSLEQLYPPEGIDVLVASMFIERSQAGKSIADLAGKIRLRIKHKPDLLLHLEQVISLTLGDSWRLALEEKFDDKLAEQSLDFFEASTIPSVNSDLPSGVSNVRFKSNLTDIPAIDHSSYHAKGNLFKVVLRK